MPKIVDIKNLYMFQNWSIFSVKQNDLIQKSTDIIRVNMNFTFVIYLYHILTLSNDETNFLMSKIIIIVIERT